MAEVTPMMRSRDHTMRCPVEGHRRCGVHNSGGPRSRAAERAELAAQLAAGEHDGTDADPAG